MYNCQILLPQTTSLEIYYCGRSSSRPTAFTSMMFLQASIAAVLLAIPAVQANLNQLAQAAGKLYFGSATDNSELSDSAYVAILSVL